MLTLRDWLRGERVVDCWGYLGLGILVAQGLRYTAVGKGPVTFYLTDGLRPDLRCSGCQHVPLDRAYDGVRTYVFRRDPRCRLHGRS